MQVARSSKQPTYVSASKAEGSLVWEGPWRAWSTKAASNWSKHRARSSETPATQMPKREEHMLDNVGCSIAIIKRVLVPMKP